MVKDRLVNRLVKDRLVKDRLVKDRLGLGWSSNMVWCPQYPLVFRIGLTIFSPQGMDLILCGS